MLIRSQNKEISANLDALYAIEIAEGPIKTNIILWCSGCYCLLGEYSTKKKASKVQDMIQEAYVDAELIKLMVPEIGKMFKEAPATKENELSAETMSKVIEKKMIFQMPEDSEVEI